MKSQDYRKWTAGSIHGSARWNSARRRSTAGILAIAAMLGLSATSWAAVDPCVVTETAGTVTLPPAGCEYLSPTQVHNIIDGLGAGMTIELAAIHRDFICKQKGIPQENCNFPGGNLGGEVEQFQSSIELTMTGTGGLAGFNRLITLQNVFCEVHTGPRVPGDPVQVFPNEMVLLQGGLVGDPDFAQLDIRAGSAFGLPSPGQTTLTRLGPPGGNWQVDSFFDVFYEIDFVGAVGSVLEGMSGTTRGTLRMEARGGTPCIDKPAPAGDDCWATPAGETGYDFAANPIPAGFFGAGSQAFDQFVPLQGASGVFDTVVRRLGDMCFDGTPPVVQTIPIEIVQLDLVSVSPITVDFGGPTQDYNVALVLDGPQPQGTLTATKDSLLGGTFDSFFDIAVRFQFTPVAVGPVLTFPDATAPPITATFISNGLPWSQNPPTPPPPCGGSGFFPGHDPVDPTCCPKSCHDDPNNPGHLHCVYPPDCQPCPQTGACCDGTTGTCTDGVLESACPVDPADPNNQWRWEKNTLCSDLDPPCTEHTGACCDGTSGICVNDVPESECPVGPAGGVAGGPGVCDDPQQLCAAPCPAANACHTSADCPGGSACLSDCLPSFCTCDAVGIWNCTDDCIGRCEVVTPPCSECGPGAHFVDACPAGTDVMNTGAVIGIDKDLDGLVDVNLVMSGPATINRGPGIPHQIATEIVSMTLTGGGATLDVGTVHGLPASLGSIVEQGGDPTRADSTFDVLFRITGPWGVLVNQTPLRVQSVIDCIPPQAVYHHLITQPIPLVDEATGVLVANLVTARHITFPDQFTWTKDTLCSDLDPPCTEHTGACCDQLTGICLDGIPESQCADRWEKDTLCVNLDPPCPSQQCGPTADGLACQDVVCPDNGACFGDCINGGYVDDAACCIDPANCQSYERNTKESIQYCGDCFGECIGGSYCDNPDPSCCIGGVCVCYAPFTDISIQLCGDCFGECIGGSYCDNPDPNCCIDPANCQCYDPTHPISVKLCADNPPVLPDECQPTCVVFDPVTGATTIPDNGCECIGVNDCHVALSSAAGGVVAGGSGDPCVIPDDGSGTVTLPPAGCDYLSPEEVHAIVDGLPAGTVIKLGAIHTNFICRKGQDCSIPLPPNACEAEGGSLNGNVDCFESRLTLTLTSEGPGLPGFSRTLTIPQVATEVHTALRTPGDAVQSFATDLFRLQGSLPLGDPDFDVLTITAGTDNGLPSPGHTTLTRLPSGDFAVDSFFDITYRIDFDGAPGGVLDGMAGSTTGTIRMGTGGVPHCEGGCLPGEVCDEEITVNADGTIGICCNCVLACQQAEKPQAEHKIQPACANDGDCLGVTSCIDGGCYVPKARYISFMPGNAGEQVALRVTLTASTLFPALVGSQWWVQAHDPLDPVAIYRLGCGKYYQDWSLAPAVIHVGDIEITSGATYRVEAIELDCPQSDAANFSAPLDLPTVQNYGDVTGVDDVPDGTAGFEDILEVVKGFQNNSDHNDEWLDLDPDIPDGAVTFGDILTAVRGFQNQPYSFLPPQPCAR